MRDYGKISPQFWIGKTGKSLRGNPEAQILAIYLMTSPHAEMTGVFYCPVDYMAKETGLGMEGATKGLQTLVEAHFCTYDDDSELVFVHEMAKYQIAEELKPSDNRVAGLQKTFASMADGVIKDAFFAKYKDAYLLAGKASPSKAPPKPEEGTEEGTEAETGTGAKEKKVRATRLPADWIAPPEFIDFCKAERPDLNPQAMQDKFRDYWVGVPGAKGTKLDWPATWRNFIRSERAPPRAHVPAYQTANDKARAWADRATGRNRHEPADNNIIDITPANT
jgi:hypothetical protein